MEKKTFYEKLVKAQVSDRSWYRITALMKRFNLPITKDNLRVLVQLKNISKLRKLPLSHVLKVFTDIQLKTFNVDGKTLLDHIYKVLPNPPHRTTISRWFDGYDSQRTYNSYEAKLVILQAFTYKLRTNKDATSKESNRKSTLSTF